MSSIAFHSKERTVRVSGRERAAFGCICSDHLIADLPATEQLLKHIPDDYIHRASPAYQRKSAETYLRVGGAVVVDGERISAADLALNTTLSRRQDGLTLIARLHAHCETHAWVDGPNRAWLAGVIEGAVRNGPLRADPFGYDGWQAVVDLLRESDRGPVVTSYSVCESFPALVGCNEETWETLTSDQRWEIAVQALRDADDRRELRPDDWDWPVYHFLDKPYTAKDLS